MPSPKVPHQKGGFTLVELMIVIMIIGLLAAIAVPNYLRMVRNAKVGRTVAELKNISSGFFAYQMTFGTWPPDSHANLPPGMNEFVKPSIWADGAPVGGNYNWEGMDTYPYAGIAIFPAAAVPVSEQTMMDNMLDNGNLGTGKFRLGTSGRPTYILEE